MTDAPQNGPQPRQTLSCRCGKLVLELAGKPIVTAVCYCDDCQEAGRQFDAHVGAPPTLEDDGGTALVLFRKDRVRCMAGAANVEEHRLTPTTPTRRMTARCCGAPMFLEFTKGHWLSFYRRRFAAENQPRVEMRVMTMERAGGGDDLSRDMPNYKKHSGRFIWRLMTAWAAMGFRTPPMERVMEGGQ